MQINSTFDRDAVSFSESGGFLELSVDTHDSTHHGHEFSHRDTFSGSVDPVAESEGVLRSLGARVLKVATRGTLVHHSSNECAELCLVDTAGLIGANFSPSGAHSS